MDKEKFLDLFLAFIVLILEGLLAALGWMADHFFEIAVLFALFIHLPHYIALMRMDHDQLSDLNSKTNEIIRLLDELNNKIPNPKSIEIPDPYDIDDTDKFQAPPMYENDSKQEPKKPTKPYPY